jgi:ribosomal protein S24E
MWKSIEEKKPKNKEMILIRCVGSSIPEVGIWEDFGDEKSEVYIPAYDDVELITNIEKWSPIP